MRELICIVCPKGCHLAVDEANGFSVTGNDCEKGEKYGFDECTNPVRVVTGTVRILGGTHPMCPVKTDGVIPKNLVMEAAKALDKVQIASPIKTGDTVLENVCGTGVNFVATRDM